MAKTLYLFLALAVCVAMATASDSKLDLLESLLSEKRERAYPDAVEDVQVRKLDSLLAQLLESKRHSEGW